MGTCNPACSKPRRTSQNHLNSSTTLGRMGSANISIAAPPALSGRQIARQKETESPAIQSLEQSSVRPHEAANGLWIWIRYEVDEQQLIRRSAEADRELVR